MSEDGPKATLLVRIRHEIDDCFPVATIEQNFERTGSVSFRIRTKGRSYTVVVTDRFLDVDRDVGAALSVLAPLGAELKRLLPDHALVISPQALSVEPT